MSKKEIFKLFEPELVREAVVESFKKLTPRTQIANPVMFLCWLGAILTTGIFAASVMGFSNEPAAFAGWTAVWLWFTVLFANFAEALAEGRARAQAAALKGLSKSTIAHKAVNAAEALAHVRELRPDIATEDVESTTLRKGDVVVVRAGDVIPGDGEVVAGIASVDESAVTGESAPVIRESGGDFSSVTGGTTVLSDWIIVKIECDPGESFIEKMIQMVEGAERRRTPNEKALAILLTALTIIFLLVTATLLPFSVLAKEIGDQGTIIGYTVLAGLLVCLIPTTIGGLLSAIGVAGMSRLMAANVIARSGRAVEAAGDVDVLLLDKTGTITFGNRSADAFKAAPGVDKNELIECALLSSFSDDTPEGKSIVKLAQKLLGKDAEGVTLPAGAAAIPFTAQTRMSGVNLPDGREIRKGSPDAIAHYAEARGFKVAQELRREVDAVAARGSTPLLVSENGRPLGVIELKDIVKPGIKEQFAALRCMGIKTVMITGDNRLTAAAIASEAGDDDFIAEATPESKLAAIRRFQKEGHLVAMTGDGTNDAPALAQADVAVAMNSGTNAAKEAANMVDLDSSPTKLMDVVKIGKQMLMTRGSLTTFSLANDIAKYFAILPAAFAGVYPGLAVLNIMGLTSPVSALLSAVIFNALIIVCLIPLALKGVRYRAESASMLLKRNLLIYGLGGVIVPFVGIKAIDMILTALGLV